MSDNYNLQDEMIFRQRWDFRRADNDFDSSSNDSKSSFGGEPDNKRHKPVLSSVPTDNHQTSKFQHKGTNIDSAVSGQPETGNPVKAKRRRSQRDNSKEKKTGARRVVRRNKVETNPDTNAALDDLKTHMNSLLDELKVTRGSLLSWMRAEMRKLAAEEKASQAETKKDGLNEEQVETRHQNISKEKAQVQYQNIFGKNVEIPYQISLKEQIQVPTPIKFGQKTQMLNLINLEEDIETQPEVQMQPSSAKVSNGRVYRRANKSKKPVECSNPTAELEHGVDCNHAIVLVDPEEDRQRKSPLPGKPKLKSGPLMEKAEPQKSIVLGIKAQNSKDGSSAMKSAARGKRAADSSNQCQGPDYNLGFSQAVAAEKNQLSKFPFEPLAPSMYLTLPSVLTKPQTANFRPENPAFGYNQPRFSQSQPGNTTEQPNPMLGSSSRNYGQLSFRDIGFFNHNSNLNSCMGNGLTAPLYPGFNFPNQFDLQNMPRENYRPNLAMNGGLGSGNYSLAESYNFANNLQMPSNYRTDGRLVSYQDSNRFQQ